MIDGYSVKYTMKEYFKLQYKITSRRFKDNGVEPLLAFIILTLCFFGLSIYLFRKTEFAEYIYILSALTLIGNLSEIRRTEFLKICFDDVKMKKIRVTENITYTLPFLFFLLYKETYLSAFLLLLLTTILALVNFRTTLNFTIWTPFSNRPFEFTIGFRNTFFLFFAAYTLSIIAVSFDNFNLGLFSILLVFMTILSFYTKPENEYFVWIYNLKPKEFLFSKIKTALLFSSSLALPIVIFLAIFYHQQIGLLLLIFLISLAFLIFIVVLKYSVFPNEINLIQGIYLALCICFPPLLFVFIPYLFIQSQNRLNNFLK